jgi:hypothetical protein
VLDDWCDPENMREANVDRFLGRRERLGRLRVNGDIRLSGETRKSIKRNPAVDVRGARAAEENVYRTPIARAAHNQTRAEVVWAGIFFPEAGCCWGVQMRDLKDRRFVWYSDKVPQWRWLVNIVGKHQFHQIETAWEDPIEWDWIRSLL